MTFLWISLIIESYTKEHSMDKSTHIEGGKEYTATPITPAEMVKQTIEVIDRKTGEAYDPKAKFDEMMNKPEVVAILKSLKIR